MSEGNTRGELIASQIKAHPEMSEAEIAAMVDAHIAAATEQLITLCRAAYHALRSYQHGNAATKLAEGVADELAAAIAKARGQA